MVLDQLLVCRALHPCPPSGEAGRSGDCPTRRSASALVAMLCRISEARAWPLSPVMPGASRYGDGVADLSDLSIGSLDGEPYRQRLAPEGESALDAQLDADPAGTARAQQPRLAGVMDLDGGSLTGSRTHCDRRGASVDHCQLPVHVEDARRVRTPATDGCRKGHEGNRSVPFSLFPRVSQFTGTDAAEHDTDHEGSHEPYIPPPFGHEADRGGAARRLAIVVVQFNQVVLGRHGRQPRALSGYPSAGRTAETTREALRGIVHDGPRDLQQDNPQH